MYSIIIGIILVQEFRLGCYAQVTFVWILVKEKGGGGGDNPQV